LRNNTGKKRVYTTTLEPKLASREGGEGVKKTSKKVGERPTGDNIYMFDENEEIERDKKKRKRPDVIDR